MSEQQLRPSDTMDTTHVACVAVIGVGTIGSSWAAWFLARGMDVSAADPAPDAAERLAEFIHRVWPTMEKLGVVAGASAGLLRFCATPEEAVGDAQFVQENGPEDLERKRALFTLLDAASPSHVIIASSSSGLPISLVQVSCMHPERCVIGHPFNPPHLVPLVEVVGGKLTSPETVDRAMSFYESIGKRPISLHKEVLGHAANRLQAALWREACLLVQQGVASVAELMQQWPMGRNFDGR